MSLATKAETGSQFLMTFGLTLLVGALVAGIVQASLVGDVYERSDTFEGAMDAQGNPNPAASSSEEVQKDWQDAQTIAAWQVTLQRAGVGALLASIFLTFGVAIFRGVRVLNGVLPAFWDGYHRGQEAQASGAGGPWFRPRAPDLDFGPLSGNYDEEDLPTLLDSLETRGTLSVVWLGSGVLAGAAVAAFLIGVSL